MRSNRWSYVILMPTIGRPKTVQEWLRMELLHFLDDQHITLDVWCHNKLSDKARASSILSNIYYLIKLVVHKNTVVVIDDALLDRIHLALGLLKLIKNHRFVLVFRDHDQGYVKTQWLNRIMKKWLIQHMDMYVVDSGKSKKALDEYAITTSKVKLFQPDPDMSPDFVNQSYEHVMTSKQVQSISRYTRQQGHTILEHVA